MEKTHRPAFVQEKDQMQKVDRKKDNIPNHHIQVASVKGRPSNHETASWQKQGKVNLREHNCHEIKISISKQSKSWKSQKLLVLKFKIKKKKNKAESICSSIYSTSSGCLGTDLCPLHNKLIVVGPACLLTIFILSQNTCNVTSINVAYFAY